MTVGDSIDTPYGGGERVAAAMAAILGGLDELAQAPWWQLSPAELGQAISVTHLIENRAVAVQVAALGEGISRGVHTDAAHKHGATWLRALVPVTPHVASSRALG